MEKVIPLEDFDWEAFENPVSSQSTEESSEETVDVTEHTIVPGTVISNSSICNQLLLNSL